MAQTSHSLCFVTAIYGQLHMPFLAPHLYSVAHSHPNACEIVLWHDLPANEIALLEVAFPGVSFENMSFGIEGDNVQRAARKLHYWTTVCDRFENNPLCFIDTDTIVLKPIYAFFEPEVDVVFTWDNRVRPINSGVLLLAQGKLGHTLFPRWIELTERIENDRSQREFARKFSWSAEQHALREIVGFVNYDRVIDVTIADKPLRFKGVEGTYLNETMCKPISENTHILHYKGGWQTVLLGKETGGEWKRQSKCEEMLQFWRATAAQADVAIARQVVEQAAAQSPASTEPATWRAVLDTLCQALHIDAGLVVAHPALSAAELGDVNSLHLEFVTLDAGAEQLNDWLRQGHDGARRAALLLSADLLAHPAVTTMFACPTALFLVFVVGEIDAEVLRQQAGCRRYFVAGDGGVLAGLDFAVVFPTPAPPTASREPRWKAVIRPGGARKLLKHTLTTVAERL